MFWSCLTVSSKDYGVSVTRAACHAVALYLHWSCEGNSPADLQAIIVSGTRSSGQGADALVFEHELISSGHSRLPEPLTRPFMIGTREITGVDLVGRLAEQRSDDMVDQVPVADVCWHGELNGGLAAVKPPLVYQ